MCVWMALRSILYPQENEKKIVLISYAYSSIFVTIVDTAVIIFFFVFVFVCILCILYTVGLKFLDTSIIPFLHPATCTTNLE